MPPRNEELPEGTDHIINGAMETNGAGAESGGTEGGGASSGFIGAGTGGGDLGGAASAGGGTMTPTSDRSAAGGGELETTTEGTGGAGTRGENAGGVGDQLKSQVYALRDQGVERVRGYADTGKSRATDMLEELSRVVADTADSIDERLGKNYGEYARKAADGVSGLAETLRGKDVDELYDNVRDAVRKSPGVAVGIAAVLGFTLARLVKAGLDGDDRTGNGNGDRGV